VFGGCVIVAMVAMGLFTRRMRDRMAGIVLRITLSIAAGGVLAALLLGVRPMYAYTWQEFVTALVIAWALLILVRGVAQRLIDEDIFKRRVLVYGAGANAARLGRLRRRADQRGFRLIAFVPAGDEEVAVSEPRIVRLNGNLVEYAKAQGIDEIVMAMDDRRRNFPLKELLDCRLAGILISDQITFLERETGKVHLEVLTPSWMIFGPGFRRDGMRLTSARHQTHRRILGTGLLRPGSRRRRREDFSRAQVPQHARRCRAQRCAVGQHQRQPRHAGRQVPAPAAYR
jgi:hypothetical protein